MTQDIVRLVIRKLRSAGIPYLVSPYEADAQLAYLSKHGIVDVVIAEDSDLILFGVRRILFKLKRTPVVQAVLFDADKLRPPFHDMDYLLKACILSGCDYLNNVPGIGLQKALNFMDRVKAAKRYSPEPFPWYLQRLREIAIR